MRMPPRVKKTVQVYGAIERLKKKIGKAKIVIEDMEEKLNVLDKKLGKELNAMTPGEMREAERRCGFEYGDEE